MNYRNHPLKDPYSNNECVQSPTAGRLTPFHLNRSYCKCVQDREPLLEGTLAFPCKLVSRYTVDKKRNEEKFMNVEIDITTIYIHHEGFVQITLTTSSI